MPTTKTELSDMRKFQQRMVLGMIVIALFLALALVYIQRQAELVCQANVARANVDFEYNSRLYNAVHELKITTVNRVPFEKMEDAFHWRALQSPILAALYHCDKGGL